jgi:hypothetical protein
MKLPTPIKTLLFIVCLSVAACSSTPPAADWQLNAQQSHERAVKAYLEGNSRVEAAETVRANSELARAGRADLLARVALAHCAAQVASLGSALCPAFEKYRIDAAPPDLAYASYLTGDKASLATSPKPAALPVQHEPVAAAKDDLAAAEAVKAIADPLARLVAAGVVFKRGQASPGLIGLAIETASAQGWRRPLLAWLNLQLLRTEKASPGVDTAEDAKQLKRRMALIESGG